MTRRLLLVVLALVALGCSSGDDGEAGAASTTTAPTSTTTTEERAYSSAVYADEASWLCRPDTDDGCDDDMDATVVEADGTVTVEPFELAADAAIDCFYVYPTVSNDPEDNSDMSPGNEERNVVRTQAARLGEACSVYAPIYRQATLTALANGRFFGGRELAYADVLDAWRHYLANDNDGRGVIIVGHSQGAMVLGRLLAEEIAPDVEQRGLLVSAMLIGATQHASDFPEVPPCTDIGQTGCVVSYASFRVASPPPANSFFARPEGDERAICTNPAALAGGSGALHPYFQGGAWGVDVTTPFVTVPGLVEAECRDVGGFNHLALTVVPGDGPRADDIPGDLSPEWGMHLVDVNVAMGDLVEVARAQAEAYASS